MIKRAPILLLLGVVLAGVLLWGCSTPTASDAVGTPAVDIPTAAMPEATEPATEAAPAESTPPPESTDTPPVDPALQATIAQAQQAALEGDLEQAIALWRQVVDDSDADQRVAAVLQLGRTYLKAGRYDMAIAQASWAAAVDAPRGLHAQALGLLGTAQQAAGEWRGAAESLSAYVAVDDSAGPYVLWRVAKAHKAIGDLPAQIAALKSIDTGRLEPSFRAEVLAELASAYRANSDPNSAIAVYDEILAFAALPDYRALISHYKGETLREASHEKDAIVSFYQVANSQPESFAAYLALQELAALPESATAEIAVEGTGVVSGTTTTLVLTDLTRGKIHYHAQEYNLALEYLNYYLHDEPELGGAEAHYYLGMTLAKQGQYDDALVHYDTAIDNAGDQALLANAWFAKAWTIGANGSDPSPFYHEFYVTQPAHPRASEALWEAALSSEEAGNWKQAADYYSLLASKYPADKNAADAAFREGLAAYAQGDPYTASTTWRTALDATQAPDLRARLITWMGLAAKLAGQLEQADIFWQEAVRVAPDSYYGLRGADLLQHTMPRLPSGLTLQVSNGVTTQEEWEGLQAWVTSWTTQTAVIQLAADERFLEARALQELGWSAEARQSVQRLQQVIKDRPLEILELAKATTAWEAYPTRIWCAQRILRLAREAGVGSPPEALLRLSYPDLYSRLVGQYAERYDLDPLLMLALMRQESLFDSSARSSAGALGLAQIMPDTGKWIASQIGPDDYAVDLLLRPSLNLKYSAWFFELLLNLYDRDWVAALVAYNAGPGNLKNWTGGKPIQDHDLFYETLPSQQAQDYVRLIYEQYS
ncbi:MAG: transglycosylase SLT domain-containing protein [Anaerolineae bacterium]